MADFDIITPNGHLRVFHEAVRVAFPHGHFILHEIMDGKTTTVTDLNATIYGIALEVSYVLAALSPIGRWIDDIANENSQGIWEPVFAALNLWSPTYDDCILRYFSCRAEITKAIEVKVAAISASSYHEAALKYFLRATCDVLMVTQVQGTPLLRLFSCSPPPVDFDQWEDDPVFVRTREQIEQGLRDHYDGAQGAIEILRSISSDKRREWRLTSEEYEHVDSSLKAEFLLVKADSIKSVKQPSVVESTSPSEASTNGNDDDLRLVSLDFDPLIDLDQAAALVSCAKKTLANKRSRDQRFPPPDRPANGGRRKNLWRLSTIRPYLEEYLKHPITVSSEAFSRLARDRK